MVALFVAAVPAMAARVAVAPIEHPTDCVYQAYPGDSNGTDLEFAGYAGLEEDVITAVPGVLAITPGTPTWVNFVGAANANSPGGLWPGTWRIQNVILKKVTPEVFKCGEVFIPKTITQQGTPNIRLWWPLMYEVPGTCWTLTIQYATNAITVGGVLHHYDDDGPGPNPESPVHQEIWHWCVCAQFGQTGEQFNTLTLLLDLFHELPFGLDEVPLISDEALFVELRDLAESAADFADQGLLTDASVDLMQFELLVMDRCIGVSPRTPCPGGPGTGIAQTAENPACCKLLVDAAFIGDLYNIMVPAK